MTVGPIDILTELRVCDKKCVEKYFSRVRDRDDVAVMRCRNSGVIFLSRSDHMQMSHYTETADFDYYEVNDLSDAKKLLKEDDQRRAQQFKDLIKDKVWLDVGTGAGGILDFLSQEAKETYAVEPQKGLCKALKEEGYNVYPSVADLPVNNIEVVTLFHVFEHIIDPIVLLKQIKEKMAPGAVIVVEVPHAKDILLSLYNLESFKSFTFWSEHLILHTRNSLTQFLMHAGFENVKVSGFQRYGLANHLHWLIKKSPGGHQKWKFISFKWLDKLYGFILDKLDTTDTIIAVAQKPN